VVATKGGKQNGHPELVLAEAGGLSAVRALSKFAAAGRRHRASKAAGSNVGSAGNLSVVEDGLTDTLTNGEQQPQPQQHHPSSTSQHPLQQHHLQLQQQQQNRLSLTG